MLDDALNWLSSPEFQKAMRDGGVTLAGAEVRSWTENSASLVADFETPHTIGRITCWSFGSCELEVVRLRDEKQLYSRNYTETSLADFKTRATSFVGAMGITEESQPS